MMANAWSKTMAGFYVSTRVPSISVRTYCLCSKANCMVKWAVYRDDEPMDSEYYSHFADAQIAANSYIRAEED
jgi:hypothetical protein